MKTVTTLLLLVFSYLSFAQTVTGMKFLKLVPDQTNGHVQDVYLAGNKLSLLKSRHLRRHQQPSKACSRSPKMMESSSRA
jgi:hypothetical protein